MDLRILEDIAGSFTGNKAAENVIASDVAAVQNSIASDLRAITDPLRRILGSNQAAVAGDVAVSASSSGSKQGASSIAAGASGVMHWVTMPVVVIGLGILGIGAWLAFGRKHRG